MNINKIKDMLTGKNVLIEGKWEYLEFDSVGIVTEVKLVEDLLVIHLDNKSKFVGVANRLRLEDADTLDFVKSTLDGNEIIIFRVKIL